MVLFGFFVALVGVLFAGPARAATVDSVRLGENGSNTRFVVEIDQQVKFTHFLLADPYRIVIDLEEVAWALDGTGQGEGLGLVADYRYGLFQPGTSRMVLDLKEPAAVASVFVLPPEGGYAYRLVIDLAPVRREAFLEAAAKTGGPTASYVPANPVESIVPKPSQRTVVIDAGHGGVDPGTISVIGIPEKKIALDMALEVRAALQATGNYRVLMTRDKDIFIPLNKRVEFSRNAGADLFISIHGDSVGSSKVRGATVYTLSETASDKEAAALARKENKSDLIAGINLDDESADVANILVDLAMRETMNYSARFAGYLVPELQKRVYIRDNSHRFAGFVVLKAPDVPSVLLEMGYLSNRDDATMLSSSKGRADIAAAVAGAVDNYFTSVVASSGR